MRAIRLAAAIAAAGLLAACSTDTPACASSPRLRSPPTGHGALAQCLSEHGVPSAPGPAVGPPPGVDPGTWQQAMQACSSLAPGPAG